MVPTMVQLIQVFVIALSSSSKIRIHLRRRWFGFDLSVWRQSRLGKFTGSFFVFIYLLSILTLLTNIFVEILLLLSRIQFILPEHASFLRPPLKFPTQSSTRRNSPGR